MSRYASTMQITKVAVFVYLSLCRLITSAIKHLEIVLVCALILAAAIQYYVRPQSQTLEQIKQTKQLRVLIADEPDSQYVFNSQHFGFEYEFLEAFAKELGAELKLDVVPYGELFTLLKNGQADIAVGGILESPYVQRVSTPSNVWYRAKTTIVSKRGLERPKTMQDFANREIPAAARYFEIKQLSELNLVNDHRSEYNLLSAVNRGDERFALSTNYRALNAKHYLPNLVRSFILPDKVGLVWALPKRADPMLVKELNGFIDRAIKDKLPQQLADAYFRRPPRLSIFDAIAVHRNIETRLPALEFAFHKAARRGNFDWHLLAAISYQESRWSNDALSPTGVRGVMQLTEQTAKQLGVSDRLDMTQSIEAAARYLKSLKKRLPDNIKEPQRTWFAVASYNLGMKHTLNAYRKAKANNLDPTVWKNISTLLPELYEQPFAKGVQAQKFVQRVKIFTDIIRFYDIHQRSLKAPLKQGVIAEKQTDSLTKNEPAL